MYEAVLGFNTKQWWVYDNDNDVFIDPPAEVLDDIERMFPDSIRENSDAAQEYLTDLCNNEKPDWLNDKDYWYDADIDI